MNLVNVSTTRLKNNVSEIMDSVFFGKKTVMIRRYGKLLGKIVPVSEENNINTDKYFGVIPDFPKIEKDRINSTRVVNFDK
jgi:hypothetical protein